jgi:hypothetical protein
MGGAQEGGFYKRSRIRIERERRTTYLRRASSSRGSQSLCIHRIGDFIKKEMGEWTSATRLCCSCSRVPKSGPASKFERFGKLKGRVRKRVSRATLIGDSLSTYPTREIAGVKATSWL